MKSAKVTVKIRNINFASMTILCFMGLAAANVVLGDTYWNGATTSWFDAASWNNGVPDAATDAFLYRATLAFPRGCTVPAGAEETATCANLKQGSSGNDTLNRVYVYGPLHVINNYLCGGDSGHARVFCYEGGSLTVGNDFSVGYVRYDVYAQGYLEHNGGSITVGRDMHFGTGCRANGYGRYIGATGTFTIGRDLSIGVTPNYHSAGNGEFNVAGHDVTVGRDLYNGMGSPALSSGKAVGGIGKIIMAGTGSLVVTGQVVNADARACHLANTIGTFSVSKGVFDVQSNFINGAGNNAAALACAYPTISVRGAEATFHIGGNFSSISNSVLVAELAGPSHTAIRVDGNVGLDGTFHVTTNGVYRPKFGDSWEIIVADADGSGGHALSGSFHTVDFSAVETIGDFRLRYDTVGKKVVLSLYSPGTVFLVR